MAFWNRNKNNDLANEFREYYQPNTNERTGLAWVLALITLVCAVFLIVSLFWGGRWIYRKINTNDDKKTNQTTNRPAATPVPGSTPTPVPAVAGATPTPTPTPQAGATGATSAPTPTPSGSLPATGPDIDL